MGTDHRLMSHEGAGMGTASDTPRTCTHEVSFMGFTDIYVVLL
jgi:hypothetical protein